MTSIGSNFNKQSHFDWDGAVSVTMVGSAVGEIVVGLLLIKFYNPSSFSTIAYSLTGGFLAGGGIGFLMKCIEHVAKQQKKPKQEQAEAQALEPKRLEFPERENVSANFDGNEEEEKANL